MENGYFYSDTFAGNRHINITITRKPQFMERNLPMQVVINGQRVGVLRNGETETYQVEGNEAELQAYLSMNKTLPVNISAADAAVKEFMVQSSMTNMVFVIGTMLVIIATILVMFTEQWEYMLIAAPPALYHLYLRFLQKDKYLVIKEIDKGILN